MTSDSEAGPRTGEAATTVPEIAAPAIVRTAIAPARQRVWPGVPYPLGATWDGTGVNVAVFSQHAEKIELCLFDPSGRHETDRLPLREYTDEVWHAYFPDLRPGQLYGLRVSGPYAPRHGHRFNPHKLLLDPYAKRIVGRLQWNDAVYGYTIGHRMGDLSFDMRDSAPFVPKCVVTDTAFTWSGDIPLQRPWTETALYELHVRGLTKLHPNVPEPLRGTFAGLATPDVVKHLRDLGVTAVQLLPIHAFVDEAPLVEIGLVNYWGYNTLGFFAPEPRYLSDGGIAEFKTMVKVLHDAGIEVILDVVYNHTAEGNRLGPTLSFRGIDNASYYRLDPHDPSRYVDFTGCGNTFNLHQPRVLQLVMDSLRYWVENMHVDGFRFDLATTLAREMDGIFNPYSSFLDAVRQDPVLSRVKLIAEPWDLGPNGYQLGSFPPGWAEWNDRYRDTVRRFWKGESGMVAELASRMTGSSDIFDHLGRRPWASVNFITAHDGFTLADLVSHNEKHNMANGEDNRDGTDQNHSWNCGVEGPTEDPAILALRARQRRNILATLLLSQGTPMLLAGDEFGRSASGNNNAYCQDNELNWLDWSEICADGEALHAFVRRLLRLRSEHVVFRRGRFFLGKPTPGTNVKDITWLRPDREEKTQADWEVGYSQCLSFVISGEPGQYHLTAAGIAEPDDTFLVIMNATDETVAYTLPEFDSTHAWTLIVDTFQPSGILEPTNIAPGAETPVPSHSLQVFIRRNGAEKTPA